MVRDFGRKREFVGRPAEAKTVKKTAKIMVGLFFRSTGVVY